MKILKSIWKSIVNIITADYSDDDTVDTWFGGRL